MNKMFTILSVFIFSFCSSLSQTISPGYLLNESLGGLRLQSFNNDYNFPELVLGITDLNIPGNAESLQFYTNWSDLELNVLTLEYDSGNDILHVFINSPSGSNFVPDKPLEEYHLYYLNFSESLPGKGKHFSAEDMDFLHIIINNNDINCLVLLSNIVLTDSQGNLIALNLDFSESNEWSVSDIDLSGDFKLVANLKLNGEFETSNLSNVTIDFGHRIVNQPPDCSQAYPSSMMLWPPNHQLVNIKILGITDPDSDPVNITIDGIYQDEPVNEKGDGNTEPDGFGLGTSIAMVRSERSGKENGRVYHIYFTATDLIGNNCSSEVKVGVPKSMGLNGYPKDDGPLYNSTIAFLNEGNLLLDNDDFNKITISNGELLSEVFPNPVTSDASIVLKGNYNQFVNVDVLDLMGNRLFNIFNGIVNAEEQLNLKIKFSDIKEGIYFIRAAGEGTTSIKKITIIK
ncbi:MAG: T9SS type A sorting domain-containing protein [Bacteroidetes bacterium]|nr:MAG: T9SS type A sorting domain-containing protein [Bacteroidota bacterium]